jgi:hypothetical protein
MIINIKYALSYGLKNFTIKENIIDENKNYISLTKNMFVNDI